MLNGFCYDLERALEIVCNLKDSRLSPEELLGKIVELSPITKEQLLGKNRSQEFVYYRQAARYLLRENRGLTFVRVAKMTGCKTHTAVINDVNSMREYLKHYAQILGEGKPKPLQRDRVAI